MAKRLTWRFNELLARRYGDDIPSSNRIADEWGLATATITAYRRGMPEQITVRTLEVILHELRCTPGELLVLDDE